MRLILKHTLKNILAHKLRTFMLIICIFGCSLTALLSVDMSGSLESVLRSAMSGVAGNTDIVFTTDVPVDEDFMDGAPDNVTVPIVGFGEPLVRKIPDLYGYVHQDVVSVMGFDMEQARTLGIIPKNLELNAGEIAIPQSLAEDYGYEVGDIFTVHDYKESPVEFKIASVQPEQGIFMGGTTLAINLDDIRPLLNELEITAAYIDVKDNARIAETVEFLEQEFPSADVENVYRSEDMQEAIDSVVRVFYVLFIVCLLLVLFVTISVSERLIVEKMSVIGTMRSLGISQSVTTVILLLENVLYGLIGSVLGCLVYSGLRSALFTSLFTVQTNTGEQIEYNVEGAGWWLYLAIIVGAVLLECICPIKEIIKAMRMPIRDIIFDNKDTEYKHSRLSTVIGLICVVVAVVCAFFPDNFWTNIFCFVGIVVATATLFPYVLRFIVGLLHKLPEKSNKPIAKLACIEVRTKKSTVGSAVLCVTASVLTIVINLFSNSIKADYIYDFYDSDVIVHTDMYTEKPMYSYMEDLPEVTDYEYVYYGNDSYKLRDDIVMGYMYGWEDGGFRMFNALEGVPEKIGYDEIVLDKHLMKKYGLSVGDVVDIEFKSEYFMPETRTLTIVGVCTKDHYSGSGATTILSKKLFTDLYHDYPSNILLKSDDPEQTVKTINKYSSTNTMNVQTHDGFMAELMFSSSSIISILNVLIVLGVGLTFIGMLSNQLIGFEGRKRECAMLTSAVMPKSKLASLFFSESFIASLVSVITAIPLSLILINRFMVMMEQLMMYVDLSFNIVSYIGFALLLIGLFTLTALFPIRAMKKMDTVTQLKYE